MSPPLQNDAAGAGDDDNLDGVVGAAVLERCGPGIDHFERESVHPLGPIEHDPGDAVGDGEFEVVGHGCVRLLSLRVIGTRCRIGELVDLLR